MGSGGVPLGLLMLTRYSLYHLQNSAPAIKRNRQYKIATAGLNELGHQFERERADRR